MAAFMRCLTLFTGIVAPFLWPFYVFFAPCLAFIYSLFIFVLCHNIK